MEFNQLIGGFGRHVGLGELVPDENGVVTFGVSGTTVTVRPALQEDEVLAMAVLGPQPPEGAETLSHLLMSVSFAGAVEDGLSVGLNPMSHDYCLVLRLGIARIDQDGFNNRLGRFAQELVKWRGFIRDFRPNEAGNGSPDALLSGSAAEFIRV